MEAFIKEFALFQILLAKIISATNNFHETQIIGSGGFGYVYSGKLSHFKGRSKVAIKRLRRHGKYRQGEPEFCKEINVLTRHKHNNLICLVGFCIENDERILVYKHASNGSVDRYLGSSVLTWSRCLKVALDAATGVSYLHDATGTKETIIHADIKSSNILLDADWNAIVSDLGLSKIVPGKQMGIITEPAGTAGYICPVFLKTCFLTNKSDVYSFGVVLLEMLCGKLCCYVRNGKVHSFVPEWQESYKQNKLQDIICDYLKQQMDEKSLKIYSDIAFRCLHENPEERPTMPDVVKELETAFTYQKLYEIAKQPKDYKEILLTAADPMNDKSESEQEMHLLKGILVNNGETWFSRNINGDYCEMISIAACLTSTANESPRYICSPKYTSRFAVGCYEPSGAKFKTHVTTQFLSPQIMYTVNLVFKIKNKKQVTVIVYEFEGQKRASYSFISGEREDGWLTAELYRFTSHQRAADLEIMFYTKYCPNILVESIEFQPENNVHMQSMSDKETYWKEKLPEDYQGIISWSKYLVQWQTIKELYKILRNGLLLQDNKWFFLDEDGKKCVMVSAREALEEKKWNYKSVTGSRFEEVADSCSLPKFRIWCRFIAKLLSPETTYGAYLVYKLPEGYKYVNPPPVQVVDKDSHPKEVYKIYLRTPQTPVISHDGKGKALKPSNMPKMKGLPKQRNDGWMEVQVHEFQTCSELTRVTTLLSLSSYDMGLQGITVQGLEFRPI